MAKNVLLKKEFDYFQNKGFLIKRRFFKKKEIEKITNVISNKISKPKRLSKVRLKYVLICRLSSIKKFWLLKFLKKIK